MSDISTEEMKNVVSRNSKSKWKVLLLVLSGIILLAAGVIGASFILPKNISGAWKLVENPEIAESDNTSQESAYYVFDKPDRYGRGEYYTCYQGGVEYFKYELLEEESVEKINLGTENMEYKITGSKLLGNAKLTIIFPEYTDETTGEKHEASKYVFEQAKKPNYEKQSINNYQVDKSLIGTWTNKGRTLSYYHYTYTYEQSVEIKDNGIMIIHYKSDELALDRYMYYAYTAKDSKLSFSLVMDKDTVYTVSYGFDENGNLKFSGDITTDSIFADAFFGDFIFYTSENLPEATVASADELYFAE